MAAWPVVFGMNVDDYKYAKKIDQEGHPRHARVSASPEQGLVVVHGTADAWALRRRIWRKMKRRASVLSDGSAPYNYQGPTAAPYYVPSQQQQGYGYGWGAAPRPPHAYYSQPPARSYPYAAGRGYDGWASDPDTYGYAAYSTVPTCTIL